MSTLSKTYLLAYNAACTFGWSVVLYKTVTGLISGLKPEDIYASCQLELNVVQTAAVLEVVHCMLGLVRSPVMSTFQQVLSRVMILWPVTFMVASSRASIGVPMYLLAWSVTECIRYPFYAFGLVGQPPYALTWLRYTLFIALYPIGVTGELLTLFAALPEIRAGGLASLTMPNRLNVSFNFGYALMAFAALYVPIFPQLYMYMFGQRRKIIGGAGKAKAQ